jgi:hypothetical protein
MESEGGDWIAYSDFIRLGKHRAFALQFADGSEWDAHRGFHPPDITNSQAGQVPTLPQGEVAPPPVVEKKKKKRKKAKAAKLAEPKVKRKRRAKK